MCRLIAYQGCEILLEDVLVKPGNSLVMQSLHARESSVRTNGDGFGLGWYVPEIAPEPALFRSIFPAWGDSNLLHLTAKIKSGCFFSHIRAASVGGTNNNNCHPFLSDKWLMMHNGQINDFVSVKRHLRHLLEDDIYNWIQGETDSEHLFALFLQLSKGRDISSLAVAADVVLAALSRILELVEEFGRPGPSWFNLCLTDGRHLIATRYCTDPSIIPESLHYFAGDFFASRYESLHRRRTDPHDCVMVASERLTEIGSEWHDVPPNHMLLVDSNRRLELRPIVLTPSPA